VKVPPARRASLFIVNGIVSMPFLIAFPFAGSFGLGVLFLGISGFSNAIINVFINAVMQLAVPQAMRGKVFSFMGMVTMGLTPIAFALGGVLAEFLPLRPLIGGCFVVATVLAMPMIIARSFRRFINFDPEKDTVESVS
jgi:DHA3 family macrolide efflux protein-like MFS transporter